VPYHLYTEKQYRLTHDKKTLYQFGKTQDKI
jgi:hypothetical protein